MEPQVGGTHLKYLMDEHHYLSVQEDPNYYFQLTLFF